MCILCQSGDDTEARVERAAQAALDDAEGTAEAVTEGKAAEAVTERKAEEAVTEGEVEATAEERPAAEESRR